jgi:hypothetical protein
MLPRLLHDARAALEQQGVPPEMLTSMALRLQERCTAVSAKAGAIAQVPKNLL